MFSVFLLTACGGAKDEPVAIQDQDVPSTSATPTAGSYATNQSVTLSCDDGSGSGCNAIYFTTDDSEPSTSSTQYTQPISIVANTTLKFFAVDKNNNNESIKTAAYLIDTLAPSVTVSKSAGTYNEAFSVSLSCDDKAAGSGCAKIFYTIDGSDPTPESNLYSTEITIANTLTLKFIAVDKANNQSTVNSAIYNLNPEISPLYLSHGKNWTDYVNNDGTNLLSAIDTACSTPNCIHGGELRQVTLSVNDCTNIKAVDSLNAFRWQCILSNGTARVITAGFNPGKHLSDLIDFEVSPPAWKSLSVEVSNNTEVILTTKKTPWWENPVVEITPQTTLDKEGTIYVLKSDLTKNLKISHNQITLVMQPGITMTGVVTSSDALLDVSGNFVWIEGMFDAEGYTNNGVINSGHHNVYSNVSVVNAADGVALKQSEAEIHGYNRLVDVTIVNSGFNSSAALTLATSNNILSNITLNNNGSGLVMDSTAKYNILNGLLVSNNAFGVWLNGASNNVLSNMTISNNVTQSLSLESANNNLITNTYLANSNGTGLYINGEANNVNNLVSANHLLNGVLIGAENNHFSGLLKVGSNGNSDCQISGTFANSGIGSDCANQMGSDAILSQEVNSKTSFSGKILQDDSTNASDTNGSAAYSSIVDWTFFDNHFRAWGMDGEPYPDVSNQYACVATQDCRIWDWSLATGDAGDNGNAVALKVLAFPNGDDVVTHAWNGLDETDCKKLSGALWYGENAICSSTFLNAAVERLNDFDGNDNGLCESNESCYYTPNIGAYQGHGSETSSELFVDGIINGAKILQFELNGR